MAHNRDIQCDVIVGDTTVSIKRVNSSHIDVVKLLGISHDSSGEIQHLYLDSYIHKGHSFNGWVAHGAISTILSKL